MRTKVGADGTGPGPCCRGAAAGGRPWLAAKAAGYIAVITEELADMARGLDTAQLEATRSAERVRSGDR